MTPLLAPKNPIYNCTFVVQSSWVLYYAHLSLNLSFSIFSSLWWSHFVCFSFQAISASAAKQKKQGVSRESGELHGACNCKARPQAPSPRLSTSCPPRRMGKQGPCCHCNISSMSLASSPLSAVVCYPDCSHKEVIVVEPCSF